MAMTSSDPSQVALTVDRRAPARFFFVAHLALLIVVLVGFAPTFYLRALSERHPLPAILILHGAVLTCWFLFTVLQAWLMQMRRVRWHRRMGYVAAGYAGLVVAMGLAADMRMASEIHSPMPADPPHLHQPGLQYGEKKPAASTAP